MSRLIIAGFCEQQIFSSLLSQPLDHTLLHHFPFSLLKPTTQAQPSPKAFL